MSLSFKPGNGGTPIAVAVDVRSPEDPQGFVFLAPEKESPPARGTRHDASSYVCPRCHKVYASRKGYREHVSEVCHIKANSGLAVESAGEIEPLPTAKRQVLFIAGPSDSGKSFRAARYIRRYVEMWPERPVVVITALEARDRTLDEAGVPRAVIRADGKEHDPVVIMNPRMEWLADPFKLADFLGDPPADGALVVVDDIEGSNFVRAEDFPDPRKAAAANEMLRAYLRRLVVDIAQNGRHAADASGGSSAGIWLLVTSHQLYGTTRRDIENILVNDATDLVIFPNSSGPATVDYFLRRHGGLQAADRRRLLDIGRGSRWVLIHRASPQYLMWSHGVERYGLLGV